MRHLFYREASRPPVLLALLLALVFFFRRRMSGWRRTGRRPGLRSTTHGSWTGLYVRLHRAARRWSSFRPSCWPRFRPWCGSALRRTSRCWSRFGPSRRRTRFRTSGRRWLTPSHRSTGWPRHWRRWAVRLRRTVLRRLRSWPLRYPCGRGRSMRGGRTWSRCVIRSGERFRGHYCRRPRGRARLDELALVFRCVARLSHLRGYRRRSRFTLDRKFPRRGPRADSAPSTVIAHTAGTLVANRVIVHVVNHSGIDVSHRAIVI